MFTLVTPQGSRTYPDLTAFNRSTDSLPYLGQMISYSTHGTDVIGRLIEGMKR